MSVRSVTIVLFVLIISAAVFADAPSITGIADNPDPVLAGNDITFDANWTDADGNSAKMYVCTTGTFDTGSRTCTDGSYCSSDYNSTPEENSCNYTTQTADIVTSPNDYYLFVCDDNECSSSSPSDFTVNANPVCSIESTTTPIVKGANTTITISYSGFGSNPTGYGSIDFGDVNAGEINLDCSSGTACTLEAGPYNNAGSFTIQNLYGLSDGTSDVNCTGSATVTVDDTPPSASVKNIAGDSSSPYYDTSDEH